MHWLCEESEVSHTSISPFLCWISSCFCRMSSCSLFFSLREREGEGERGEGVHFDP